MKGKIVREKFEGRELLIYLPQTYETDSKKYPVVYVHDLGDVFDPAKSEALYELERMFADGSLLEVILVGVESKNRMDEYTPWFAKALSTPYNYGDFGGKGGEYLSFLANKLKPYMDASYRTAADPEHTAVIGKSLGGLISMYAAYLCPGVFGKIGSISGSYWFEGFVDYMRTHAMDHGKMKIYMDVGSLEGVGKQTVQKDMVPLTGQAHAILRQKGFSEERLTLVTEEGAVHEHSYFCRRFPSALRWLFHAE